MDYDKPAVDSTIALDAYSFDEEARHPCPRPSPLDMPMTPIPDRPRTLRCDAAQRELLRQRFSEDR